LLEEKYGQSFAILLIEEDFERFKVQPKGKDKALRIIDLHYFKN